MTVHDTRAALRTPAIPRPREPEPEPWHVSRGTRPRSEYWVAAAGWHSRGPVSPRAGAEPIPALRRGARQTGSTAGGVRRRGAGAAG
jgi:hypothetical protein